MRHSTRYDRRTAKYISKYCEIYFQDKPKQTCSYLQFCCKNNYRNVDYNLHFISTKKLIFSN